MVQFQDVVVFLGGVYRALVWVQYRLPFRFLSLFIISPSSPSMYVILSPRLEDNAWLTISLFHRSIYSVSS